MSTNRTVQVGGVWAEGAADVPGSPIAETTYRKSALSEAEINAGWPYAKVVNSADLNEVMLRLTTLMTALEEWGMLNWCATTTYGLGAWCLGSDNQLYQSLQAANLNHDPVAYPTWWAARINDHTDTILSGTEGPHGLYAGYVSEAGSLITGPSGWSASRTATGKYTLTHNLNRAEHEYSVQVIIKEKSGVNLVPHYTNVGANTVEIWLRHGDDSSLQNAEFAFTLAIL